MRASILAVLSLAVLTCLLPDAALAGKRDPNWPCSLKIVGQGRQDKKFTYSGPAKCHTTPDLDLIGCPTVEELSMDGKPFRKRVFTYDPAGNLVKAEYIRDGKTTTLYTTTWDANGQPVKSEVDTDLDGKSNIVNTYKTPKPQTLYVESSEDGKLSVIWTYQFDKDGRILGHDTDRFADGTLILRTTGVWKAAKQSQPNGNKRLVSEQTVAPNGKVALTTTFNYACK